MKPFWVGNLQLGLLAIPVGLVPVVRANTTQVKRLHAECATPISTRAWCGLHDRLVADDEIARGFEVAPGQHLLVDADELAATAPEETRTIEVRCAIDADSIPRALVAASYYLAPSEAPAGRRPYMLVRATLADSTGVVLLARLVVKGHEWLAQIRPECRLLILDKLHPIEDLVDPTPLDDLMGGVAVTEQEQQLAHEVVRSRTAAKVPAGALQLEQRARVRQLVDAKLAGGTVQIAARPRSERPTSLPTDDLADTLRRSVRGTSRAKAKHKPRPGRAAVKR